ncbi:hypothetical protein MVI01_09340 [Myxococcus virescens]|uniref:Uncharacterized protein n=1 Tax=Myxococcus virescens TaxID=83456 RepID=A0A511H6K5_9BACT|nr:hypothetical protein MVI01_09340 [Myxococcus virescens]
MRAGGGERDVHGGIPTLGMHQGAVTRRNKSLLVLPTCYVSYGTRGATFRALPDEADTPAAIVGSRHGAVPSMAGVFRGEVERRVRMIAVGESGGWRRERRVVHV